MEEKNIAASAVTKEMIAEWKKKHGDVYVFTVTDDDGTEKKAWLRKPDRKLIGYSGSIQNNPIKSNEVLLNGCWLAGDEDIKTNDALFFGISNKLGELIKAKEGELVKL
ncbi:MAG: hypothetical protein M9959_02135 [Chitinophagaceae bacterium]|nr:hypothetical protein [Chitinophagaceae bacterium]